MDRTSRIEKGAPLALRNGQRSSESVDEGRRSSASIFRMENGDQNTRSANDS